MFLCFHLQVKLLACLCERSFVSFSLFSCLFAAKENLWNQGSGEGAACAQIVPCKSAFRCHINVELSRKVMRSIFLEPTSTSSNIMQHLVTKLESGKKCYAKLKQSLCLPLLRLSPPSLSNPPVNVSPW